MPDYDNELRGALFRNDKKRDGKKDPDYRGSCEVLGTEYWIDAWINEAKDGRKYMSLRFNPKEPGRRAGGGPTSKGDPDSDIPFISPDDNAPKFTL